MQTFVNVIESGSFSGAADRLGVAKSAVSRRITELEEHLGVQLLTRTTRRLNQTDAGRDYYQRSLQILSDIDDAEQAASSVRLDVSGTLRVSAPLSFGQLHITSLIHSFLALHPRLSIDLNLNDRRVDLIEEGIDVGIRIGQLQDSTLIARRLASLEIIACATPEYLEKHGVPNHPTDLMNHNCLNYSNTPEFNVWHYVDNNKRMSVKVAGSLRANNGEFLSQSVLQGFGIGLLPNFLVCEFVKQGVLVPILSDYFNENNDMYAIYPSGRHLSQRSRMFIDYLVEYFDDNSLFEC